MTLIERNISYIIGTVIGVTAGSIVHGIKTWPEYSLVVWRILAELEDDNG